MMHHGLMATSSRELATETKHRVLLLLVKCCLLFLNLLNECLLIHQLRQGFLLVDEFKCHSRIFFAGMDHLKNLINCHLESEWSKNTTY